MISAFEREEVCLEYSSLLLQMNDEIEFRLIIKQRVEVHETKRDIQKNVKLHIINIS